MGNVRRNSSLIIQVIFHGSPRHPAVAGNKNRQHLIRFFQLYSESEAFFYYHMTHIHTQVLLCLTFMAVQKNREIKNICHTNSPNSITLGKLRRALGNTTFSILNKKARLGCKNRHVLFWGEIKNNVPLCWSAANVTSKMLVLNFRRFHLSEAGWEKRELRTKSVEIFQTSEALV